MKSTLITVLLLISVTTTEINSQETKCYQQCFAMKDNRCEICYKACKYDGVEKYEMKSCKANICLYESQYSSTCISSLKSDNLTEQKCLEQCCKSEEVELSEKAIKDCHIANQFINKPLYSKPYQKQSQLSKFMLALLIIFVTIALIIIGALLVIHLSKKIEELTYFKIIKSDPCDKQLVKSLAWRDSYHATTANVFEIVSRSIGLRKCSKCKKQGPYTESQCHHYYHLNCLIANLKKTCGSCSTNIQSIAKVYCQQCKLRMCSIYLDISEDTFRKLHNFGKINCDKCIENDGLSEDQGMKSDKSQRKKNQSLLKEE